MKAAVEYIARRVPEIGSECTVVLRTNSYHRKPLYRVTYKDIAIPKNIAMAFKRMYYSADIMEEKEGFSITLSLKWETFQGGYNGVTIFSEYIK